jgi:CelD/BcsL family acetyltransferase involved in cellulose biosynthesis
MLSSNPFELEIVRTEERFQELEEEWSGLYAECIPGNPFLSFEWSAACRTHVCRRSDLFVVTARAGGRLVGVAPLRRERISGFRVVRFLAGGWSDYSGFLCHPDTPEAEPALLEALAGAEREWDLLALRQLAREFTRLPHVRLPKGLGAETLSGEGSPYVAFAGDWQSLCAEGPGWLKGVQKRVRRFQRDGGTVQRLKGDRAAEAITTAAQIESQSWQAQYGDPIFQRQSVRELFAEALRELEGRGELELWLAEMEGKPIAYEINFLSPDRIWLYRGGYDQEYARYGPGSVLEFYSIRTAWEEGRREYDYGSGCEPYKAERTNAVRQLQILVAYPHTPRGYLAYALLVAPRSRLRRHRAGRAALDFLAQARRCPQALLPWNRTLRNRVY